MEELEFSEDRGLRWIDSPDSAHDARRGFCGECGSSLFWHVPGREKVSIAAGCLDAPTGIRTVGQIWVRSAGDYYDPDDRVPGFEGEASEEIAALPPRDRAETPTEGRQTREAE
jgi:hypothetical protein